MSHAFLQGQVQKHKRGCSTCKAARFFHRGRRYSLCTEHLAYARDGWRTHVRRCRAAGRCIDCHDKKLHKEQRCAVCKERNRSKCLAWSRARPEVSHRYWLTVRRMYLQNGLCICKGHPQLPAGYRRCDECRHKKALRDRRQRASS
jgi:hypothetical protein